MFTRFRVPVPPKAAATLACLMLAPAAASAGAVVDGTYDVSVGGFRVGVGGLKAEVSDRSYSANITVRLTGLARLMADGRGSASSSGTLAGVKPLPARYSITTSSGEYTQSVRMALAGGSVQVLVVDPLPRPRPDMVPITLAHRRGVVDPVSALVMPVPGNGEMLTAASCNRVLPVFDGRARYDIVLSFDRIEPAQAREGSSYGGPLLVCRAGYRAISGHRATAQVKQLEDNRDMEVWLAPVGGTRVLIPWRISVRTSNGDAVIEARQLSIGSEKREAKVEVGTPEVTPTEPVQGSLRP